MSNEQIKNLLTRLHAELETTDVDAETRSLIKALDADIHDLLDADSDTDDPNPILERAQLLQTDFANKYPVAERVVREIMDTLAKIGV